MKTYSLAHASRAVTAEISWLRSPVIATYRYCACALPGAPTHDWPAHNSPRDEFVPVARGPCHKVGCCDKIEVISQERRRTDAVVFVFNTGRLSGGVLRQTARDLEGSDGDAGFICARDLYS
jgi:hypothetical protein